MTGTVFIHRFDGKRQEEDVLQKPQSKNSSGIMVLKFILSSNNIWQIIII